MKRSMAPFLTLLLSFIAWTSGPNLLHAQTTGADCSYLVAGRTYAHVFAGFLNSELFPFPGLSGQYPNAGVGTVVFNADGTVGGTTSLKIGPAYIGDVPMLNATYKLSWDTSKSPVVCTGTMKSDVPQSPTGAEHWQLLVRNWGAAVELIHTDTGLIVTATTVLAHQGRCSNHTLHETYTYNTKAWTLPPPGITPPASELLNGFMPFAFSGAIRFRPAMPPPGTIADTPPGAAYVEGWDTVSLNGLITPRTYVGWYKVSANCSAEMVLLDSIGNPPIHTKALVLNEGKQIDVLNIDVPLVLSFTATRQ